MISISRNVLAIALLLAMSGLTVAQEFGNVPEFQLPEDEFFWGRDLLGSMSVETPPTPSPPTEVPATPSPPTPRLPTNAPPTPSPPTPSPPISPPPTPEAPTEAPPTGKYYTTHSLPRHCRSARHACVSFSCLPSETLKASAHESFSFSSPTPQSPQNASVIPCVRFSPLNLLYSQTGEPPSPPPPTPRPPPTTGPAPTPTESPPTESPPKGFPPTGKQPFVM